MNVEDRVLLLDTDEMRGRVISNDDPERQRWPRMEIAEIFAAPRTAASAELLDRAAELFARSRRLPRFGADATRAAMVNEANMMLLEASRIDAEERRQEKLRRVRLWEIEAAGSYDPTLGLRPAIEGGPSRKARRAERARWRKA